MREAAHAGVYPNPSSVKEWTDHRGRIWRRRGGRGELLDEKRTRRLLRSKDVSLVTWWAGVVEWFDDPADKESAAIALYERAVHPDDVFTSEWKNEDSDHLLMLEHFC